MEIIKNKEKKKEDRIEWSTFEKLGPSNEAFEGHSAIFDSDKSKYHPADLSLGLKRMKEEFNDDRIPDEQFLKQMIENPIVGETFRGIGFIYLYGWVVPTEEAISAIKKFVKKDRVVDIGAGYGLMAKLMQDTNIDVTPTDMPDRTGFKHQTPHDYTYTEIERIDNVEAMKKYGDFEVLMLSWAPAMAFDTLKSFKGNKLIYIGEEKGGQVACDEFFDLLESEWELESRLNTPNWRGYNSYIFFYNRK